MGSETRSFWRRLDYVPAPIAVVVSVAAGAVAGFLLMEAPLWLGGPLFVVGIGLGLGLAARGRAIVDRAVPTPRKGEMKDDELDAGTDQIVDEESDQAAGDEPGPAEAIDPLTMVRIEGGTFVMGSGDDDPYAYASEKPAHEVAISGLACMVYPVTRGLYADVMGHDPGWPSADAVPADELDTLPANNVSWRDAIAFCNALSEQEGLTPCYSIEQDDAQDSDGPAGPDRSERDDVVWHREADGYRLPTEAEWEFLCRAGTQSRWSFGDDESALGDYAWFDNNAENRPHSVGSKKPNAWGLHDMHGNVLEWCWDWYAFYDITPQIDPTGPTQRPPDEKRLLRGGAFYYVARNMRCAYRVRLVPTGRYRNIGFRCVRGVGRQP
ncbi:MAG: formylglycine-generating enzyme family protein [Proteobacteria bacterium]|nr:formylglycine-generating enzyme family protein [Pseudomonadota bacterium]